MTLHDLRMNYIKKILLDSDANLMNYLTDVYSGFFLKNQKTEHDSNIVDYEANKFTIWSEVYTTITAFLQTNQLNSSPSTSSTSIQIVCQYLYWPLSLTLNKFGKQVNKPKQKKIGCLALLIYLMTFAIN